MCGICGQLKWNTSETIDRSLIEKMNRSITSRGPDDEGYFLTPFSSPQQNGSVALAMRRLSIIDVASGRQPLFNENKDVVVVYNGETYNYQELRSELIQKGHHFSTQSDTEVLVHGYEEWGLQMPEHLNGMFAFALWDMRQQQLVLGRDRMGIKPLYYSIEGNTLSFGSEIKALLQWPGQSREIDPFAIDDFLSLRYIPTPRSIYKNIRKLEPGCLLIWNKGRIEIRNYWNFTPRAPIDLGLAHYLEKTDALLADAVKRQLVSEVPLGTFLSGGVDSPTITYYAKKEKKDLLSFNIFFNDKSFSERTEAKGVANFLGTHHIEKEVTPHILDIIPKLIDIFDEPFGDDSMIPTYFLTKMAREKMTVALSGDGGDELFGGYPTYVADQLAHIYRRLPHLVTQGVIEPLVNRIPVSFNRISLDYKAKAFINSARRPSPLEHFGWTEVFKPDIKDQLYSTAFKNQIRGYLSSESYQKAFDQAGERKGIERFLYVDQKTHLLDEFLVKVDRLSMAHSLEVRPPFLDHRLVEFAAEIPMKYKIKGMQTKYILRKLMRGRLPSYITDGAKKGFSPPMAKWLTGELREYVQKKFSPQNIKDNPYLNPETPMKLFEQHLNKKTNLARRLWTLLMFVEWYDRKILGKAD